MNPWKRDRKATTNAGYASRLVARVPRGGWDDHIIWAWIIVESGAEIRHRARKHNDLKCRALREAQDRLLHRSYLPSLHGPIGAIWAIGFSTYDT